MSTENKWLEGFVEYAAERGVPMEAIPTLVKVSALMRLQDNPDFAQGFEKACADAGLQTKEAGLTNWLAKILLGGLGVYGGVKGVEAMQSGMSPAWDMRRQMQARDQARVAELMATNRFNERMKPFEMLREQFGAGSQSNALAGVPPPADSTRGLWMSAGR